MLTGGVALLWGPPRSGTTWLYNVVRDMLDESGVAAATWVYGHPVPDRHDVEALVVKSHQAHSIDVLQSLTPHPHIHLVGVFRDPARAFQSLIRTQSVDREELLGWLARDIASIDRAFSQLPDAVVIREEWIATRSAEMIAALASYLSLPLNPAACARIAHRFRRDNVRESVQVLSDRHGWSDHFRHYDSDTHWHANHIAPDDHVPHAITDDEQEQLEHLALIVGRLTARHSLLADLPARGHARPASRVSHDFLQAAASRPRTSVVARLLRKSV
jgi:hypothetical protein